MEEACLVVNESVAKHQSQNNNSADSEENLSDCLSDREDVEEPYKKDENEMSTSVCASIKSENKSISTDVDTGHEYAPNYKLLSSFTSEWLQSLYTSDEQEIK